MSKKARKTAGRAQAQLGFEALTIEGGLIAPEWLSKVAQLAATGQSEADYGLAAGRNLRDEIASTWRVAQGRWAEFERARGAGGDFGRAAEEFVVALLERCFGFASVARVDPMVRGDRAYPIGFAALGGRVPVVIAPAGSGVDTGLVIFADGGRRRSAFGLLQEYLNAEDAALWGIASDGLTLRMARDNGSLTRPAWIEADLGRLFTEERYADFAALWLLVHASRFGREGTTVTDCPLEIWRNAGREQGTRAREHLRRGVEDALMALGQGFLAHPDNQALRAALQSGALSTRDYFNQLLRLVYRLIFLLTVEERGVLHPDGADNSAKSLYASGYSMRSLRERSAKRSAHDRFVDLWEATKIVFRGVETGEPRLGLPALAGIFAKAKCPALDAAKLENHALLLAVFKLAWLRDDSNLARVNWRDMGPEELGSVYESLLELVPQITKDGRQFAFATGGETKGNARKTTGSYYTPDSLVQVLLDSALEPVVKDTLANHPENPVEALLGLSIVDPACGSGHFLLAAARRLASHVARIAANGTPSAAEYRHALRQVVGRCIYGVDLNPMAVELCKVSLWMEAVEPGLPLTFLNSHIQHGNALLGTTPELMAKGIPDAAWDPIEGDDKKTASALKKRNKKAADGQRSLDTLWSNASDAEAQAVARAVADLEAASDANHEALAKKEQRWDGILRSDEYRHQKLVADAWCAAFVWPKQPGELGEVAPTNELWRQLRDGRGQPPALTTKTVGELAEQYRFFHWNLQFPQVFAKGGFDVVLGNPPWEHMELKEEEWFAERVPEIAAAPNAAARKRMIATLRTVAPAVHDDFVRAVRAIDGENHVARETGRYPLCARGRINTFALFAEHNRNILNAGGALGCILPAGIATDDTTKEFFQSTLATRTLLAIYHFENEERVFVGVNNMFRFVLLTLGGRARTSEAADVVAFARSSGALSDPVKRYRLSASEIVALNPNTRTFPTFPTRRDADINLALYRRAGVLWRDDDPDGNPWGLRFMQGVFNMASDSSLFRTRAELEAAGWVHSGNRYILHKNRMLPLFEAKMVHQFDHRFATYDGATQANLNKGTLPQTTEAQHADMEFQSTPQYWVAELEVEVRLETRWGRGWLLGWRDITNAHNERTVIASLIPRSATGDTFLLAMPAVDPRGVACLYANLCSIVLDYAARQKVGGTHIKYHTFKQLPVVSPSTFATPTAWLREVSLRDWILPRVLELTYTALDLEPFARDCSYEGPPFRWDRERRFAVRAELDAAFFHVYGLSRVDADFILDTFPVVKKNDEKAYGEYRTKRAILEAYDVLAAAARSGRPYRSPLFESENGT